MVGCEWTSSTAEEVSSPKPIVVYRSVLTNNLGTVTRCCTQ